MPPRINKFLVALAGTIAIIANAVADGRISQTELIQIVVSAVATILVYVVPNHPTATVVTPVPTPPTNPTA